MRAKVTTPFKGRPDDEFDTRTINAGEIITGDLAAVAVREKWAEQDAETGENQTQTGASGNEGGELASEDPRAALAPMKKAELLELAEAEGVPVDHGMTKAVLIDAIVAARAAKDV